MMIWRRKVTTVRNGDEEDHRRFSMTRRRPRSLLRWTVDVVMARRKMTTVDAKRQSVESQTTVENS